jgi:hypothetical protein
MTIRPAIASPKAVNKHQNILSASIDVILHAIDKEADIGHPYTVFQL